MRIKALIVDDEPLARESLSMALSSFEEILIIGECADGFEAVKAVQELRPDILFLDIQMPKLDGFDVVELLGEDAPYVVFVTAYDEYALKAFETHALDYLLKPVKPERFARTLEKIKKNLSSGERPNVQGLLQKHQEDKIPLRRILVKDRMNIHVIPVEKVICFEAQDDYVSIRTASASYLKKETLSRLEKRLDARQFIRIHRSYLLNIIYLSRIEPYSKDSRIAVLQDGSTLPVSRSGYAKMKNLL
ncbi:MAG: LytTR family transcriptional regulator DNA-binding domain-containing protein [Candidatus Aminicenantes bacterium]|nr:LytTR family transcriptional regulator DNA-binding domain-containing protein [Candidatus Aminicenantes bacterium]